MPEVHVRGVPAWVDTRRLLGEGWVAGPDGHRHPTLSRAEAADVQARLRGLGMGGQALQIDVVPPLKRKLVRDARAVDARRRRDTTPGFTRPGVRLDPEARRSLTPERLALALGRRAAEAGFARVVDATTGAGGNAIGFARAGCHVVGLELDPARAADARHNASIYGVDSRLEVRVAAAEDALPRLTTDLVFVDPPWGEWDKLRTGCGDVPALGPILAAVPEGAAVWCKLPPSFDPAELADFSAEAWFGAAPGDRRRIKFVLMCRDA